MLIWASCMALVVKNQAANVGSLGWEDPLEKDMATPSTVLAWRIPWTEGPAGYSANSPTGLKQHSTHTRFHLQSWKVV